MRAVLVVLALAAAARADGLRWERGPNDWYTARDLKLGPEPPDGVSSVGEGFLYHAGPFGSGTLLFALHLGTCALRIDADFDGDLGDEATLYLTDDRGWRRKVVTLAAPEPVPLLFYRHGDDPRPTVLFAVLAHREGDVELEGRMRRVMLFDVDHDLRFGGEDDEMYLDLDGDGTAERGTESPERIVAEQPFRVRQRSYVAAFAGLELRFRPSKVEAEPARRPWTREEPPAPRTVRSSGRLDDLVRQFAVGRKKGDAWSGAYEQRWLVTQVGNIGTPEAFAFLLRVYRKEKDGRLKVAAVEAMGNREYAAQSGEVVAIVQSAKDPDLQVAALDALHRMDAPGRCAVFATALAETHTEAVFAAAARNLGYLGTPEALGHLEGAARAGPFRYHAYLAWTRARASPPPAELIAAAAREGDARLKALALEDARFLQLPEARGLALEAAGSAGSPDLRLAVTEILGALGDGEAVAAILPYADGADATLRGRLLDLLRPIRDAEGLAVLLAGLDSVSPAVRGFVAEALAGMPVAEAGQAMAARLRVEREEPALTALIRGAGHYRVAEAAAPILEALDRDPKNLELEAAGLAALARIGVGRPGIGRFLAARVVGKELERRIACVDALGASADPCAAPLLLPRLDDKEWQVRLAAIQALGLVRVKEAVPALIALLAREERRRLRGAAAESLFRLTGEDHGDMAEIWARWWRERSEGFQIPAEVPQRKEAAEGERRTVAAFYGVPVDSERVIFVIDISGSMGSGGGGGQSDLDKAVQETLASVAGLPSDARVNVILFESIVRPWRKGLVKLSAGNRKDLTKFLRAQVPTGGTNLYDALEAAVLTPGVETVYLLSDGQPGSGKFVEDEDIVREITRLNRSRRVVLHCVALGYESSLLRALAAATSGTYARR